MNDALIYFIKVNIAIALFYLFYRLFFAGDTFWKARRFYLTFTLLLAFVYPFFSIQNWLQSQEPMQTFVANYGMLQEFTITPTPEENSISVETIIGGIYALVSGGLFIRMIIQLLSIYKIRRKGERIIYDGKSLISLEKEITPFSFFGDIYINPALHTEREMQQILAHELTHVKQLHSLDVLIAEIVTLICWINPAAWLLKREIRQNLEYLADNKVIESGFDTKNYQYHLLQLSYQIPDYKLTNKFNISPLKKRITMMNQQKTSKAGILKYLLIVPLALSLVVSSNAETIIKSAKETITKKVLKQEDKTIKQSSAKTNKMDELTVVGYGAQETQVENDVTPPPPPTSDLDETVFQVVENMPIFPGGEPEMIKFLAQNIKYPAKAQQIGQQAKILVQFIVSSTGKVEKANVISTEVTDVKFANNSNEKEAAESALNSLKQEALRVVNAMPDWTPGKQRGVNVNVQYTLPINFVLQGKSKDKSSTSDKDQIFMVVETMPIFPGGDKELFKFLGQNIRYPVEAQKKGIQGRVLCQFVIDKDGSIDDIKVVKSVDINLDAEAMRVISVMPKWTPGKQRGEVVRVKYTLPVNFKLDGGSTVNPWGNKPLVFLDGNRMPANFDVSIIKPESIDNIKDNKPDTEEAKNKLISEFGKWAGNGVIFITTKKK